MPEMEKMSLIKGVFTSEEAKELLKNLYSTKIKFHELKNFSHQERFGTTDEHTSRRILELKEGVKKLNILFEDPKLNHDKIFINAEITISFAHEA